MNKIKSKAEILTAIFFKINEANCMAELMKITLLIDSCKELSNIEMSSIDDQVENRMEIITSKAFLN